MKIRTLIHFILALSAMVSGISRAASNPYANDFNSLVGALAISKMDKTGLWDFENPTVGKMKYFVSEADAPWAGNYFPNKNGGVAVRWQSKGHAGQYSMPSVQELREMSDEEINKLSAAEKIDILKGDYNYSFTKHELSIRGPWREWPSEIWEGLCNGMRCSGQILPEPVNVVKIVNRDGIRVTFQPADIKALTAISYFYVQNYAQLGAPSRNGKAESQPNPAAFDLTLRYYFAELKRGFVVDTHLGSEIWNESIVGYSRFLHPKQELTRNERNARPWAVSKLQVDLNLFTLGETDIKKSNGKTTHLVAGQNMHDNMRVSYTLFLDGQGKAKDGLWHNKAGEKRGVDFVWFASGRGTDAEQPKGNPYLKFDMVEDLVRRSANQKRIESCGKFFR